MSERQCHVCGGPIPEEKKAGTKYCGKKCLNSYARSRKYFRELVDKHDQRIDTFGFLTRKGLAR